MRNDCETKVYENHAQDSRIRELDGDSPAIPAKAGTGGGQPPARPRPDGGRAMRDGAVGVDLYNAQVTGGVSVTLRLGSSDADHVPCVIVPMACPSTSTTAAPRCTSSRTASSSGPRPGIFKE